MADLLQDASAWLEQQRTRHAAHVVIYVRGSRSLEILATVGKTVFEAEDGYGVLIRHESRDFLILADNLILDGQMFVPQRGDQIQEIHGSTTFTYEVTAPGKEPAWRYSDPYRKTVRIHTQQILQSGSN